MAIRRFALTLTGQSPMLMHADDVEWSDEMSEWKDKADNKKNSKAGDDRYPLYRWTGYLYHDGEHVALPTANLMTAIRDAASGVPIPGGKNGKTFKQDSVSGLGFVHAFADFYVVGADGKTGKVPTASIMELRDASKSAAAQGKDGFAKGRSVANRLGFDLDIRRASVGTSKHVRVRPRFDRWIVSAEVEVWDEKLAQALPEIVAMGGRRGLGDWRPSSPKKPGPYGRYLGECKEIEL